MGREGAQRGEGVEGSGAGCTTLVCRVCRVVITEEMGRWNSREGLQRGAGWGCMGWGLLWPQKIMMLLKKSRGGQRREGCM
jgi:hypothetical protein